MTTMTKPPDFDAIKLRQQTTWSSGDYSVIGTTLQLTGERLAEAVDVSAGERVLDVAAGNGNAALAAARRGARVIASDYVPELLDLARRRAVADGLTIAVREGDAEALPFAGSTFDVVMSTFGVMFTPQQERAAAELVRVTKPGGRIGLANWTPDGFVGQLFKLVGRYAPPPEGVRSPLEWGTRSRVQELLGGSAESLVTEAREFVFRYRNPKHWLDTFRSYYGPMHKAFAGLDAQGRESLEHDLLAFARAHNTSRTGTLRVPSEYLEFVVVKRR
jgi:SAM-dependent methyltransferase